MVATEGWHCHGSAELELDQNYPGLAPAEGEERGSGHLYTAPELAVFC
jgi:hypothetical protein